MANMPEISIGGTNYKVKDAEARDQISDLKSAFIQHVDYFSSTDELYPFGEEGYILYNSGLLQPTVNARNTGMLFIKGLKSIWIRSSLGTGASVVAFYNSDREYIKNISIEGEGNVEKDYYIDLTNSQYADAFYVIVSHYGTPTATAPILKITANKPFVQPENTSFFEIINYYDPSKAVVYRDRYVNSNGVVVQDSSVTSIMFEVKPNTHYWFYAPGMNRGFVVENSTPVFKKGAAYTLLTSQSTTSPFDFTTGANANYVFVYIYNTAGYDYDSNKNEITLNIDTYNGNITPFISQKYMPKASGALNKAQVLIFGDSITDTCAFTINDQKQTTNVVWGDPSNHYVDEQGKTVYFSMWPKIIRDSQNCLEIRNYALSGASYKTASRAAGFERQNVHYQIDVAINDKDNPNQAFIVDHFLPDIVIFALGVNDGVPNDTFESAMNKTVLSGNNINVDATIANLDETKFCESARKAFMRIKKAFPMAQLYCVLPIQRAGNDIPIGNLHSYLKQVAERYGCIIINGAYESGITRDMNIDGTLGMYLKDGLHPNEKGQNLMARMILTSIYSHYIPFEKGFNK